METIRDAMSLGNVIARKRKSLGLSQTQLGAKVGMHQYNISIIERGHPGAKISTILEIASMLGLEIVVADRKKSSAADFEEAF